MRICLFNYDLVGLGTAGSLIHLEFMLCGIAYDLLYSYVSWKIFR